MVTLLDWTTYLSGTCKGLYLRMDTKLCKMRFDFAQTVLTITGCQVQLLTPAGRASEVHLKRDSPLRPLTLASQF